MSGSEEEVLEGEAGGDGCWAWANNASIVPTTPNAHPTLLCRNIYARIVG